MWHLTCGDLAAESVRRLLGEGEEIRVLRDDLAVGPLAESMLPRALRAWRSGKASGLLPWTRVLISPV
jgi:hypothetical protein